MIKKVDYFRKLRAWGSVFLNQYPIEVYPDSFNRFKDLPLDLEKVITYAEALELPEENDPDLYCQQIISLIKEAPEDIRTAYGRVEISIFKSFCLWRLLYCNEELRTIPCPEHKGRWSFIRDCICGDSGFLPNE